MHATRIRLLAIAGLACVAAGFAAESASALNPQPLPPRIALASSFSCPCARPSLTLSQLFRSPGSLVSLNPQPLPPRLLGP